MNGSDLITVGSRDAVRHRLVRLSARRSSRAQYPAVLPVAAEPRETRARPESHGEAIAINWWLFGRTAPGFACRSKRLPTRYIVTVETAKHRVLSFLDWPAIATRQHDHRNRSSEDAMRSGRSVSPGPCRMGIGSWRHSGGPTTLHKTRCFETFPFPPDDTGLTPELTDRIRHLAEQLDAHRKARQAAFDIRHAHRPVQRARQAAPRRGAFTQGKDPARAGPGQRAAQPARRAGRRRAGRLRLERPRPRALGRRGRARRLDRGRAGAPGGPQRPTAPPRRPPAPSAGCAPTSRTRRAAPSAQPPPPRRRGPPPMDAERERLATIPRWEQPASGHENAP